MLNSYLGRKRMIIRRAEPLDLEQCLRLDGDYQTERVWQMQIEENDGGGKGISFHPVRLPRPMAVPYPRSPEDLSANWERRECFLVAEEGGRVQGFLDMVVHTWNKTGWVNNLVVSKDKRRRGVGTALLRAAIRWSEEKKLQAIVLETQTKNDPAISFLKKHGFLFSGFHDRYYATRDIALFFALDLH